MSAGLAGAASGAALGWAGSALGGDARAAVGTTLLLAVTLAGGVDLLIRPVPMLQLDRETSQSWLHLGSVAWPIVNGLALGTGFLSRIGFLLWYMIPITCLVVGQVPAGAVIFGTYGLTRGLSVFGWFAYMSACRLGQGEVAEVLYARKQPGAALSGGLLVVFGLAALISVGI